MIRVLIVDDSPTVCRLLAAHLQSAPDLRVVGTAQSGERAVEMIGQLKPDAVTLDIDMPGMSGLEALRQIMETCPTPTIMVSGVSGKSVEATVEALDSGAVDFVLKYVPGTTLDPESLKREIIGKVRVASRIQVVRTVRTRGTGMLVKPIPPATRLLTAESGVKASDVVVIGASTGGPVAVRQLLEMFGPRLPAAVLVVQHMPAGFTTAFAAQLDRTSALTVREAADGDSLKPGTVLVAPGGFHVAVTPDRRVRLTTDPEMAGHRPAVDYTMASVVPVFGNRTIGVLLTGMGRDGADGMQRIRQAGGRTFAQDAESCVVNGMPQSARDLGVVDVVGPPDLLGRKIESLFSVP
jgi:two-component system chemotaxis response regulator CheB